MVLYSVQHNVVWPCYICGLRSEQVLGYGTVTYVQYIHYSYSTGYCAVYIYVFRQLSYTIPSKTIKTISFRKGLEMIKSIMDGGRYAKSFHLMNLVLLIYTPTCH